MVRGYEQAAQEYERARERACEPCEPKVVWHEEIEPNVYDETYNCKNCENKDCEYWEEYNE